MTALGGAALHQPAHVIRQPLHVERSMLHVIADIVGEGLSVFHPLLECPARAGMRTCVVDGLTLFEKFDGAIDPLWFRLLRRGGDQRRQAQAGGQRKLRTFLHTDPPSPPDPLLANSLMQNGLVCASSPPVISFSECCH